MSDTFDDDSDNFLMNLGYVKYNFFSLSKNQTSSQVLA